ncbi:MAG TPA: TIGR02099 family protein [Chromatiaceae bacterium]|nr:TIGR02099 family protein [Chromatiaceae bacterium]
MIFWAFFKRLMVRLTGLLYLIVILGAVAKVLVFGFALYAENNKQTIQDWASAIVGTQVHFNSIETYWAGVTPRIWVRQLTIGDEESLTLGDVLVGMNLGALPWWKENLPVNIHIKGTEVQVLRDKEGRTRILGMLKPTGGNLPTYVFLEDATIDIRDEKRGAHIHQQHLNVRLFTRGNHSSLSISSKKQGFRVRAEIDGSIAGDDWSGTFWTQGKGLKAEQLLQAYLPTGYLLSDLHLNFQAWSYWQEGQHLTTRVQLDLDEVSLYTPDQQELELDDLKGDLLYEKHGRNWKLQMKDFRLATNDYPWKDTGLAMLSQQGELLIGISQIDLEGAAKLLPLLPPDNPVRQQLQAINPKGVLSAIRINMNPDDPESRPVFRSKFDRLSFLPQEKLPGIRNFSGSIRVQQDQAQLTLDTRDAQVLFTTLFRQPLPLEKIEGELFWQGRDADNWSLYADHLVADSPDLQTISRLRVDKTSDEQPILDVQTDFRNGRGEHAGLYYPAGIMSEALVGWLDAAVVSGRVPQGSFLYHGPLAKGHFPFHKTHDGHFEVLFDVEDLMLSYHEDWPPLTGTNARVRFHNNSLDIAAKTARIYSTGVHRTTAGIGSLEPLKPLVVKGSTHGPVGDFLRLLRETPLKDSLAERVEDLAVTGKADASISLHIPLPPSEKAPPAFRVALDFKPGTSLTLKEQKLRLDDLRGTLLISEKGLVAEDIRAKALGTDIALSASPAKTGTLVEVQGKVSGDSLARQYPQLASIQPQGEADINLKLEIPGLDSPADTLPRLHIRSDLQGMALNMPAPIGKTPASSIPLLLDIQLGQEPTANTLKYGNLLGVTYKQNPDRTTELLVRISSLDVKAWANHFSNHSQRHGLTSTQPTHIRLEAGTLDAPILNASSFVLDLRQQDGTWKGRVDADNIKGHISFVQDKPDHSLILDLEKLHLHTGREEEKHSETASTEKLLPDDFPTIRLSSKSLKLNKANLGRLEFVTRKDGNTQIIEKLDAHGKLTDISIHGSWEYNGNAGTTWLKGVINTDNMGKLLRKALDMDFLSGSKTYLSFDLNWLGAPFQPNIAKMRGEAQLDMAAGRILNFKPGLARVLGLVNFDTLYRRLKLDFKDVYQKGMAFDTIMGNFQFDDGLMYTNNLEILGPSATILIAGSIDLINETYDQILSVSPRLDATLPVASAIAGGPAAGLVVLLAQQAFSEKLQKIQRITYDISGTWEDPKLTRHTPEGEK